MAMRLPNDQQRCVILGKTGSGKTQAGIWQLAERSWPKMPWIIFDFKRDPLINTIPEIKEIQLNELPESPGIFVVRPLPNQEDDVERLLWEIWKRGSTGLFIDEGYMLGKSQAFIAILTQGRSKRIPVITLSQRPSWVSRFVFSEADFIQYFWLNDIRDRKTVEGFVPADLSRRLRPYWSIWYDVSRDQVTILRPVPRENEILNIFLARMPQDTAPTVEETEPQKRRYNIL